MNNQNQTVITRGALSVVVPSDFILGDESDRSTLNAILKNAQKVLVPTTVRFTDVREHIDGGSSAEAILLAIKLKGRTEKAEKPTPAATPVVQG